MLGSWPLRWRFWGDIRWFGGMSWGLRFVGVLGRFLFVSFLFLFLSLSSSPPLPSLLLAQG